MSVCVVYSMEKGWSCRWKAKVRGGSSIEQLHPASQVHSAVADGLGAEVKLSAYTGRVAEAEVVVGHCRDPSLAPADRLLGFQVHPPLAPCCEDWALVAGRVRTV